MLDLLNRFIDFEAAEDASFDGGAEAGVDPEPQTDPRAGESDAEPASPAWAPDPQEWQRVVGTIGQLDQLIAAANEPPAPQPLEIDPYAEDFPQTLEQVLAQRDQQILGQLQQAIAPLQQQQQQAWVEGEAEKLPQAFSHDFTSEGLDLVKGAGLQAPGNQESMQWVAQRVASIEKAAADRAVAAYKESLGQPAANAGPAGGGASTEIVAAPKTYDEIIQAHASRRNV